MVDLTYEEVARWLTAPVTDALVFENWIGNRLYGVEKESTNKEWEEALLRARFLKTKPNLDEALKEINSLPIILDAVQPLGILTLGEFGTIICPGGKPGPVNKVGAEVNGQKINFDEIFILKVPKGETVKLKIKLHGDLKLEKKNSFAIDAQGGDIGIIIDTRGRPLVLPDGSQDGRARLTNWQKAWEK